MNSSSGIQVVPVSSLDWPGTTERISIQCCGPAYIVYSALRSSDDAVSLLRNRPKLNGQPQPEPTPLSGSLPPSSSSNSLPAAAAAASDSAASAIDLTLCSPAKLNKLNYYQILGNIPVYSTQDAIRKAYYKACLKYHPDKDQDSANNSSSNSTNADQDPVFLKVKEAFDTLSVPAKRKAYDSTSIPFDDSIPSLLDISSDADFYTLFGACFERNIRFAQEFNPDNPSSSSSSKNKSSSSPKIPSFGQDDTPMEQVYSFYQYWDHFDSWRDFSLIASQELEHDLDMAQDRFEKRYMEKEIKKLASKLKKNEMMRIQKLVERAKSRDPRIVRDKERKYLDKIRLEQEEQERIQLFIQQQEEEENRQRIEDERLEQEKIQLKKEKDQMKLQLRMARSWIRKVMVRGYELEHQQQQHHAGGHPNTTPTWVELSSLNEDVELLTSQLHATSLMELTLPMATNPSLDTTLLCPTQEMIEASIQHMQTLSLSHLSHSLSKMKQCASDIRHDKNRKVEEPIQKKTTHSTSSSSHTTTTTTTPIKHPWSKDELSALAKAVKKYPPGCGNRWDSIATFVNNACRGSSRNRDECIEKFNHVAHQAKNVHAENTTTTTTAHTHTTAHTNGTKSSFLESKVEEGTTTTKVSDWTEEQDQQLQMGLAKYPSTMDKNERWVNIASCVKGKSKKECVERFKIIREAIMKNKES